MIFNKPAQGGAEFFSDIFATDSIADQSIFSAMKRSPYVAPLYLQEDENIGVVFERGGLADRNPQFVSEHIIPNGLSFSNTASINYLAPLFILSDDNGRRANFDIDKLQQLFSEVEQPTSESRKVYPEDIFDYIYASLHSPSYREKYKEFLKTDFPRVPRPENWAEFWRKAELGGQLRQLHLMKSPQIDDYDTTYPEAGDNLVDKIVRDGDKVFINTTQYFGNVPDLAWNFYIGGYQPAQKWLKDRRGRTLGFAEIEHYQRIIKILLETDRIMKEVK